MKKKCFISNCFLLCLTFLFCFMPLNSCSPTCGLNDNECHISPSIDPCPPLCEVEGYYSSASKNKDTLYAETKKKGINKLEITWEPSINARYVDVSFYLSCDDLSLIHFPTLSFNNFYHDEYDSSKYKTYMEEHSLSFETKLEVDLLSSLDAMHIPYSTEIKNPKQFSFAKMAFNGSLVCRYKTENTIFQYAKEKELENMCFFISSFFGDSSVFVYRMGSAFVSDK